MGGIEIIIKDEKGKTLDVLTTNARGKATFDLQEMSSLKIKYLHESYDIKTDRNNFLEYANIMQNDVIHIPYKNRYFTVKGGVQRPGEYEYNINDNVNDALIIAGGLYTDVDTDSLRITRSTSTYDSKSFFLPIKDSLAFISSSYSLIDISYAVFFDSKLDSNFFISLEISLFLAFNSSCLELRVFDSWL